jgi:hypothetical protein
LFAFPIIIAVLIKYELFERVQVIGRSLIWYNRIYKSDGEKKKKTANQLFVYLIAAVAGKILFCQICQRERNHFSL